jgi:hypothetical protein
MAIKSALVVGLFAVLGVIGGAASSAAELSIDLSAADAHTGRRGPASFPPDFSASPGTLC